MAPLQVVPVQAREAPLAAAGEAAAEGEQTEAQGPAEEQPLSTNAAQAATGVTSGHHNIPRPTKHNN